MVSLKTFPPCSKHTPTFEDVFYKWKEDFEAKIRGILENPKIEINIIGAPSEVTDAIKQSIDLFCKTLLKEILG